MTEPSRALKRGCEQHGVRIDYRPPATPRFGGHIERLMVTLTALVHALPGTTSSNPIARGDYPSEQKAVLTLRAFERILALEILGPYHNHGKLKQPIRPVRGFKTLKTAYATIEGFEVMRAAQRPGRSLQYHARHPRRGTRRRARLRARRLRYLGGSQVRQRAARTRNSLMEMLTRWRPSARPLPADCNRASAASLDWSGRLVASVACTAAGRDVTKSDVAAAVGRWVV